MTEDQIKEAMKLLLERMKVFIEPSAAVPLAVLWFDEVFRKIVEKEAGPDGCDVGVILSGGNTTVETVSKLYECQIKHDIGTNERNSHRTGPITGTLSPNRNLTKYFTIIIQSPKMASPNRLDSNSSCITKSHSI